MPRLLATLALLAAALPAAAEEIVLKAVKVYTQAGPVLAPGMVRVTDGKVAEVAANITPPAGAKVIDLGAGTLIPGLVDAHTTIGIEGEAAEITEEVTPNFRVLDAVDWSARGFRTALAEGTTTIGLVPGTDNVIAGLSSVVKTAGEPSRRVVRKDHALVITLASDPSGSNLSRAKPDSIYVRQPTNRMGVVWMLRSELGRAKHSTAPELSVVREALDGKRPVVCVSRIDADLTSALRLRHEYGLNLVLAGGQEAYMVKDELAAAKVPILLGPLTSTGGPTVVHVRPPQIERADVVLNHAGVLHQAGITFALTGGHLLDQARFAVRYGLPADAALAAVTTVPAKLLGVEGRVGAIAVGKDADLVALSGDPFDLATTVRWTMTDGVIRSGER